MMTISRYLIPNTFNSERLNVTNTLANKKIFSITLLLIIFIAPLSARLVSAEQSSSESDQAQKAYDIMAESDRRDIGWQDSTANMTMIIRRADGREVIREVTTKTLEGENGKDKSLLFFAKPLDVKGTVFLTHSFPLEADKQWIYLPSQNRVKRISSKRKTGRFMGSEFTFEDMAAFSLDKNNYRYLGETECGEPLQACHIIETRSKDPYTGYEKTISHIDKTELRSWEIDFYSRRTGKLSKQLRISNYQLYLDKFWRPDQLSMLNTTTKAETILKWHEQQFNIGLADSEFRKAALERRQ